MQLVLDSVRAVESVTVKVTGLPQAQGSKTSRIVGKRIRLKSGEVAVVNPKVVLTESGDMQTETLPSGRLSAWRKQINRAAFVAWREAHGGTSPDPWDCACELAAEFVLVRPDGDWRSPGVLRKGAREYPETRPDLSKLVRAIEDSLTGVVFRDDGRVVRYGDVFKRYAAWGGRGGVVIRVRPI